MEKIAIITDVHGCLIATETIFKDIEKRGIKHVFCLGDLVAKGSQPKETLELVRKKCEVVLKGNCDEIVGENGKTDEHMWNKIKIGKENMEYLASLPLYYDFYISGLKVRLLHASPKSLYSTVNLYKIDDSISNQIDELFEEDDIDVVIFGHIHRAFFTRRGRKTAIAVGSVSNGCDIIKKENEEAQYASYLILEGEFGEKDIISSIEYEFIRVPYDYKAEIENLKNTDMPNKEMAIKEIETGIYVAR